ncbi:CapA family protein [Dactylosporangium sp. NPDC005555]|uniref:CapA family protein n=1 Tax=Dactylosporangium sp. NPDC005555 TaxID=3154889 RepID=UPI0033A2C9E7
MTVYGGPPSDPSPWPDDREQPPHDQPPARGQGYGQPGPDPRGADQQWAPDPRGADGRASDPRGAARGDDGHWAADPRGGARGDGRRGDWGAEPGTAAWGSDAGAAAWGGDGGRGADPATAAWSADTRPGDPRGTELRGGDFRAAQQPPSAWAPEDHRTPQPPPGPAFGGGAQGTASVRGSASPTGSLFDPARGAATPGRDGGGPQARGAASTSSFDSGPQARGSAQPTGSMFDAGAQGTGPVRGGGGAQPAGAMFDAGPQGAAPVRGSAQPTGPMFDTGERATGQVRGSARPAGGTYGAAAVPASAPDPTGPVRDTGAFQDGPPQGTFRDGGPQGTFRDAGPQGTGTFRDAGPQGTGTFRDAGPQGAFRDGPPAPGPLREPNPQATGTFRDADLQSTGSFRDSGPAAGGMFAAGGPVSGPAYGEGPAYGDGPGYNDGPAGPAFGAGQATGPVYGGQATGPVYGATRAPDPGATRGPEDLFAAQAYQPEERAGRRKLPLPGENPPPRGGNGRRTAIILGAIAALVIGAGTAGAATFLSGDDPEPGKSQPPAVAKPGSEAATPGGTAAPAGAGAGTEVTMTATGDIVMGMAPGGLPPNNGKGFFDPVKEFLTADFQMGNLEQVLTEDTGVGKCSAESAGKTCFAFRTPPSYVNNLKDAGFHMMTMANNHAYDFGEVGYKNSQKAMDGAGIKYTGWPGMVSIGEAKGLKIAVVGFASYKWSNLCSDLDAAETVIKEAATKADLVVVQVHQGAEGSDKTHTKPGTEFFLGENRCDTIAFAHKVIDAGADLVVGHGPHVMRAMEFYKGRLIAYSLGNFAGYRALSYNGTVGIGGVLKVTMTGDGTFKSGSLTATYMVAPGLPKPDPKKQAIPFVSNLTKQDFPTTGAKIAADGTITQPAGG